MNRFLLFILLLVVSVECFPCTIHQKYSFDSFNNNKIGLLLENNSSGIYVKAFYRSPSPHNEEVVKSDLTGLTELIEKQCPQTKNRTKVLFLFPDESLVSGTQWLGRIKWQVGKIIDHEIQSDTLGNNSYSVKPVEVDRSCVNPKKQEHFKSRKFTSIPANSERRLIGVWLDVFGFMRSTRSIEEHNGKYYMIFRDEFCKDQLSGLPLKRELEDKFISTKSTSGDYFRISKSGELQSFDREGLIDTYPKYHRLFLEKK